MPGNNPKVLNDLATRGKSIILCESEHTPSGYASMGFHLDICDESLDFRIATTDDQVGLAAIVPLANAVSAKIVHTTLQHFYRSGGKIACHKDCNACCHYLVPITVPEALSLKDDYLARLTARQQTQMLRCALAAAKRILSKKLPPTFAALPTPNSPDNAVALKELSNWFEALNIKCPFLRKDICTIYQQRPLACREHFATGSNEGCIGKKGMAKVIDIPIRIAEALGPLASTLEGTDIESIILPFLPAWWEQNPDRGQQLWPASVIVEHFALIVEKMAAANPTTTISPAWQ